MQDSTQKPPQKFEKDEYVMSSQNIKMYLLRDSSENIEAVKFVRRSPETVTEIDVSYRRETLGTLPTIAAILRGADPQNDSIIAHRAFSYPLDANSSGRVKEIVDIISNVVDNPKEMLVKTLEIIQSEFVTVLKDPALSKAQRSEDVTLKDFVGNILVRLKVL
ncbi:MAG: hypothetical protein KGH59_01380 [Candidatus Micrarchaeota archaeon]|nr:hypothetical protein [Candidatus Micrarchaeota archaeon]MDE1804418.1 hypothetical protein [Candidatus Micrarchaeota archaeon]